MLTYSIPGSGVGGNVACNFFCCYEPALQLFKTSYNVLAILYYTQCKSIGGVTDLEVASDFKLKCIICGLQIFTQKQVNLLNNIFKIAGFAGVLTYITSTFQLKV